MTFRLDILKSKLGDLTQYKYCGGDYDSHKNYFNLLCKTHNYTKPDKKAICVCEQSIKNNCYITKDDINLIVMGSCCIRRFLLNDLKGRTCDKCNKPHKNRVVNLCNDCRKPSISIKQPIKPSIKPSIKNCLDCKVKIDPRYVRCYNCFMKKAKK